MIRSQDPAARPRLRNGGRRRSAGAFGIGLALSLIFVLAPAAPSFGSDGRDAEMAAMKAEWQDRYRTLLEDADRLRAEIAEQRELYAAANRRNYRRGSKRHVHRAAAAEATRALADVEQQLATIKDDGRRAGALPGWFYEVEMDRE